MKKIILVFLISFSSIPMIHAADYFSYPLVRVSYDFNLGYTTSIGGGIIFRNGDMEGGGPYFLYSFSHKKQNVSGKNFSVGLLSGLGIASIRVGINRMLIFKGKDNSFLSNLFPLINKSGEYWGLEASAQMFLGNVCGGFLFDKEQRLKLNGSVGLGIF